MSTNTITGRTMSGGAGAQTLVGTMGDDVIYGDSKTDAPFDLRVADREGGDQARGPGDVVLVTLAGKLHAYAAASGLGAGGVQGWRIDDGILGASLKKTYAQDAAWYDVDDMLTGAQTLATIYHQGQTYLVTAGLGVSLARLDNAGVPQLLASIDWDWGNGLLRPGALVPFDLNGELRILVGGGVEGGATVLRYRDGALQIAQRTEDDYRVEIGDVSAMEIAIVDRVRYAVVASRDEGAVSVWRFGGPSPTQMKLKRAGDGESRFDLTEVEDLKIAKVGEVHYVYAAGPEKLVTYRLTGAGDLVRVAATEGALALETASFGGRELLFAAEADRIRVYEIGEGGRLDLVETHDAGRGARITDLAASTDGDRVVLMAARSDADGHDLLSFGAPGDDRIQAAGGDDVVHGGLGDDVLYGGDGEDRMFGAEGDDFVRGDTGDDRLDGGAGDDVIEGGGGRDLMLGRGGDDVISAQGWYNCTLRGGDGRDRLSGAAGKDRMWGDDDADFVFGASGDDQLHGGAGADKVDGGDGKDRMWGDGGQDLLRGGTARDKIYAGGGNDRVIGGRDDDRMWGGQGKDVFVFSKGDGKDRVMDFGGKDRLEIRSVDRFKDLDIDFRKGDAIIEHKGGVVILDDVSPRQLDAHDFLFG
ncbi:calcium-binding protein [Albimonas sp. CAU 1670]|uniref:calcium-binding protein n=1 Tax=Albimonas sp. CAU 1670 TaxID=3032599 RepID=UPI0023DA339C|nr:calcium-binding protein [Albimonas sp. CAU 1670]MDF2232799.1 calcium-binding protein [Albimonas sp. CAU 1670]